MLNLNYIIELIKNETKLKIKRNKCRWKKFYFLWLRIVRINWAKECIIIFIIYKGKQNESCWRHDGALSITATEQAFPRAKNFDLSWINLFRLWIPRPLDMPVLCIPRGCSELRTFRNCDVKETLDLTEKSELGFLWKYHKMMNF